MAEDDLALPVLDAILACLCAELDGTPGGSPCFCSLIGGGQLVPADYCSCDKQGQCGQAWVRLVRIYPWANYPQQDLSAGCKGGLAAVVELGVLRCRPTPDRNGPPSAVAQTTGVQVQMGDWQAMRRTLECCEALSRRDVVLGSYEPRSQADCQGGTLTATVKLGRFA